MMKKSDDIGVSGGTNAEYKECLEAKKVPKNVNLLFTKQYEEWLTKNQHHIRQYHGSSEN